MDIKKRGKEDYKNIIDYMMVNGNMDLVRRIEKNNDIRS
jgi:hypothetical protein